MSTQEHTESHGHGHTLFGFAVNDAVMYAMVLAALLVLTIITVLASYVDLGSANIVVAVVIATCKASLVGLFFMHLAFDKPINAMVLVGGFMFLGLLLSFTLLDIDNRMHIAPTNKAVPKASGIMAPEPGAKPAAAMPKPE